MPATTLPQPDTSTATTVLPLPFYPAYTFSASRTWDTWVKLTCNAIHHDLRPRPDFPSNLIDLPPSANNGPSKPLLLFHLNHPVQYVQITGIIVAIEDTNPLFYLLTVDDSSGSTLDLIYWKPRLDPTEATSNPKPTTSAQDHDPTTENILILLPTLHLGTAISARGLITSFRGTRQLSLLRLQPIYTTTAELQLISKRNKFLTTVLNIPWHLSASKLKLLREKAADEHEKDDEKVRRARRRIQRMQDREARHEKEILKLWEEEEKERATEAEKVKVDAQKLEEMKGEMTQRRDMKRKRKRSMMVEEQARDSGAGRKKDSRSEGFKVEGATKTEESEELEEEGNDD